MINCIFKRTLRAFWRAWNISKEGGSLTPQKNPLPGSLSLSLRSFRTTESSPWFACCAACSPGVFSPWLVPWSPKHDWLPPQESPPLLQEARHRLPKVVGGSPLFCPGASYALALLLTKCHLSANPGCAQGRLAATVPPPPCSVLQLASRPSQAQAVFFPRRAGGGSPPVACGRPSWHF